MYMCMYHTTCLAALTKWSKCCPGLRLVWFVMYNSGCGQHKFHCIKVTPQEKILYTAVGLSALHIECASNTHSVCIDHVCTANQKTKLDQMSIEPVYFWRSIGMDCQYLRHCLFAFSSYLGNDANAKSKLLRIWKGTPTSCYNHVRYSRMRP